MSGRPRQKPGRKFAGMQPDIKKNYIFRLIYELICFGVPLVTTPYVSRVLGAEGVGVYSFTYSVIAWFMMLVILGNATYGIREISRKRDDAKEYSALFWEIQILSIISLCICLVTLVQIVYDLVGSLNKFCVLLVGSDEFLAVCSALVLVEIVDP